MKNCFGLNDLDFQDNLGAHRFNVIDESYQNKRYHDEESAQDSFI